MLVAPTISTKAATLDIRIVDYLVLTQTTLTKVSSGDLGSIFDGATQTSRAVAPFVGRQRHHRVVDSSIDRQHAVERLFGPLPPEVKGVFVVVHCVFRFNFRPGSPNDDPCAMG